MIIYTDTVFLPKYGVELTITRKHGQRWWVVGNFCSEGGARERARKQWRAMTSNWFGLLWLRWLYGREHCWRGKRGARRCDLRSLRGDAGLDLAARRTAPDPRAR